MTHADGDMARILDAVHTLIERHSVLPPPLERARLRKAHGLTQADLAGALRVSRTTVVSWEAGRTEPRPPHREVYARLLERLGRLYPLGAPASEGPGTPPAPEPGRPPRTPPARPPAESPAGRGTTENTTGDPLPCTCPPPAGPTALGADPPSAGGATARPARGGGAVPGGPLGRPPVRSALHRLGASAVFTRNGWRLL
ncbi:helix-turn-helix transcriptional regulator [Streptomyces sp. DSM 44917]|uniref:Helix-turn-helix transcriptional regulator n=1 Tax=Streptomyces boetiae TaxID=3075541 RepID=A0ABU2L3A0_9ACTN|nr:helix-turn-helix transcriptional regulator [Streptomyces sp. DSM 44917]MDT0305788.1 helix-turn-helix transcriptional regulator [Streptomyces sp. DSM 44917]